MAFISRTALTGALLALGLGTAHATTPAVKTDGALVLPTGEVSVKEKDVALAPVVAPTPISPQKSAPAKLPITTPDIGTKAKDAPVPLTPILTPGVKLPGKQSTIPLAPLLIPGVKAPVKEGGIGLAPITTPHINVPIKDKGLSIPVTTPNINVPIKDKGISLPVTTPNVKVPVKEFGVPLGTVPVPAVGLKVKQVPHAPVIALAVPQLKLAVPPPLVPVTKIRDTRTKVFVRVGRESSRNIFIRGGNAYVTIISPQQQCIGPVNVSVEAGPELSCRPQAQQRPCFERSQLRKLGPGDKIIAFARGERVVSAVCVDDTGREHPASRIDSSERVASGFKGELYRCVAGTHLKVRVGEVTPTGVDFSRGESFVCAKGEALYLDPEPADLALAGAAPLGDSNLCLDGGVGGGF